MYIKNDYTRVCVFVYVYLCVYKYFRRVIDLKTSNPGNVNI